MSEAAIAPATEADRPEIAAYLATRSATCMIMRTNLHEVGLTWTGPAGATRQSQYVVARRDGGVIGVAAHCWNNNVLIQADVRAGALVAAVLARSGRRLAGLLGPLEQVDEARGTVGDRAARVRLDTRQTLMALALDQLVIPPALQDERVVGRRARLGDRAQLIAWRAAYLIETGVNRADEDVMAFAAATIDGSLAAGQHWVIEGGDALLAMCSINASLPDAVQIGGVYTPAALRSRGHARAVVAAALRAARDAGATQAVLFTPRPDAVAAYRAVGFAPTGEYAIVLFDAA